MEEWKSAAHARYILWYHFVWTPKYRREMIRGEAVRSKIREVLREIEQRYDIEIKKVGIALDHLHLFLGAAPRYSPSEIANIIKSITAKELLRAFPWIREELWGGEFWEVGYAVRTVGDKVTAEIVKRYIEGHHKSSGHEPHEIQFELF